MNNNILIKKISIVEFTDFSWKLTPFGNEKDYCPFTDIKCLI